MQAQALTEGMLLDVAWSQGDRDQTWVGRVSRIDPAGIVGEPLARQFPPPSPGTSVRLTTAVGAWTTEVCATRADGVVFRRPGAAPLANRRAGLRVRVNASASWRPHPGGPVFAAYIEDLSMLGVRILSERVDGVGVGTTVIGIFAGHEGVGEVRSVQPHPNARLAWYGIRFVALPPALARTVDKVVGTARTDPANWV